VDGAADRGANAGRDGRACEKREEGRSVASQAGREKRGEEMGGGGGPALGVPRGAGRCGAWLRPAGGVPTAFQPTVARPRRARAARHCSDSGAGADARAPAVSGRGSEKREARRAWAGPGMKRVGRAQMNSMILDFI
jgi:hypothetical protein